MKLEEIGYASVRGILHEKSNSPNQDAYSVKRYKFGTILVVSDGLGSKKHSDLGSKAVGKAVDSAVRIWNGYAEKDIRLLLPLIVSIWNMEIYPYPAKDCGATCLFAVAANDGHVYLGQLGDGSIYISLDNELRLVKEKEEDFTNLTVCMGGFSSYSDWTLKDINVGNRPFGIVMMTDGVSETMIDEKKEAFINLLFKRLSEGENLSKRNNLIYKILSGWNPVSAGDDRTLICYRRR
ncbi:MAG: protein phosphatase 2C domain-containing protein [Lachnospiraceae bacterium]|nr:protein phosphatase 2C domain-containing protein [Lachnospiraceae bacterium]